MDKIIRTESYQGKKSRITIFLEGGDSLTLGTETVKKYGLSVGASLDAKDIQDILTTAEASGAYNKALSLLAVRPRSKMQMYRELYNRGYEKTAVLTALERLSDYSFINDYKFAEDFIRLNRKKSRLYIVSKLKEAGVVGSVIESAFLNDGEYDESAPALMAAQKYLKNHDADFNKLYAHLRYKGFSFDSIKAAVNAVKDEISSQETSEEEDY